MSHSRRLLGFLLLAATPLVQGKEPMARVNGEPVLPEEVTAYGQGLPEGPGQKALLEELINRRLLLRAARKEGLAEEPAVRRAMERARNDVLIDALLDRVIRKQVTPEAIRRYYRDHIAGGPQTGQVRLRRISADDRDQAASLKEKLAQGTAPEALEREPEPARWVYTALLSPAEQEALAGTKPGTATEPVALDGDWAVLIVQDRRQVAPPPLAAVRIAIRERLERGVVHGFLERLRSAATIEYPSDP